VVSIQPSRFPSPFRDRADGSVSIGVLVGPEAGPDSLEKRHFTCTRRKSNRGSPVAQLVTRSPCLLFVLAWVYGV